MPPPMPPPFCCDISIIIIININISSSIIIIMEEEPDIPDMPGSMLVEPRPPIALTPSITTSFEKDRSRTFCRQSGPRLRKPRGASLVSNWQSAIGRRDRHGGDIS
jgi:hypothetical protein